MPGGVAGAQLNAAAYADQGCLVRLLGWFDQFEPLETSEIPCLSSTASRLAR